ncbi:MAG: hypothetical protein ACSLFQ_21430 [Thermoanaerobaculia bacterium]
MRKLFDEMAVMVACRVASLATGLLMIPILLHFLGGDQFAAWALYLAVGLAFSSFESASTNTLVRFAAASAHDASGAGVGRFLTNLVALTFVVYAAFLPVVLAVAAQVARLIRLPEGELGSPAQVIVVLYGAAMLRALLMPAQGAMLAGGNLRWFSLSSFVISLAGNVVAVVAGAVYRHADAVVFATWAVQLLLLAAYAVVSWRRYGWGMSARELDRGVMRAILGHASRLQVKEWAQFFNYQFGKFLISALTGLWAVGPYEVANRAVLALRSVPFSGLGLSLPAASAEFERGRVSIELYRETTRYAAFGALLFLGVPLAAGWYFMFAWAGQFGYYARWAFPALGLGALAALVAVPAALLLQAEGRPDVEARAAVISVLINLPVSLLLIPKFGAAGASLGIGLGTAAGAVWLLSRFHRLHSLSMTETLSDVWRVVREPALVVATAGVLATASFKLWLTPQLPVTGFSGEARMWPAVIACGIGLLCGSFVALVGRKRLAIGGAGLAELAAGVSEQSTTPAADQAGPPVATSTSDP